MRNFIETSYNSLPDNYKHLLLQCIYANNGELRYNIRQYFGTPTVLKQVSFPTVNMVPTYNKIMMKVTINDNYNDTLNILQYNQIDSLFFLTETYGYFFQDVKKLLSDRVNLDEIDRMIQTLVNISLKTISTTSHKYSYQFSF